MERSSASVNSQTSKQNKHKWTALEDASLVACMVDLRNIGTHNVDTGFKSGYLPELEKMLCAKIPDCALKARPHIESRLKTLKRDWSTVYDMMYGPHTSGFGWDVARKMVTAEEDVWNAYVATHKDAASFRTRSFPHFEELSLIYAKDRATGRDAQDVNDILEEIEAEDAMNEDVPEENNSNHENTGENVQSASGVRIPARAEVSGSSGRKRKRNAELASISSSLDNISVDMKDAIHELFQSVRECVQTDIVQKKILELPAALRAIDGLTDAERFRALRKYPNHPHDIFIFFGCTLEERLMLVKDFITNE